MNEDIEILKNYMGIDEERGIYTFLMEDYKRVSENISEDHLFKFLRDLDSINNQILKNVQNGEIVFLTVSRKHNPLTYIAKKEGMNIPFKISTTSNLETRSLKDSIVILFPIYSPYPTKPVKPKDKEIVGNAPFSHGNWNYAETRFIADSHVTSQVIVDYSDSFWDVTFQCYTGKTVYGTTCRITGTGTTGGPVKWYWWWTGGGSEPFNWVFDVKGPPGGNASGEVLFINGSH